VNKGKNEDLIKNKSVLIRLIEKEIVKRYYFNEGKIKDSLKNDNEVKKAISILSNANDYMEILNPAE
jgi:carboxyl-terminal processing protease